MEVFLALLALFPLYGMVVLFVLALAWVVSFWIT